MTTTKEKQIRFSESLINDLLKGAQIVWHLSDKCAMKSILVRMPKGEWYKENDGHEFEYKVFKQRPDHYETYHATSRNGRLTEVKKRTIARHFDDVIDEESAQKN